jgi:archaellum component FlaD/FlaE
MQARPAKQGIGWISENVQDTMQGHVNELV